MQKFGFVVCASWDWHWKGMVIKMVKITISSSILILVILLIRKCFYRHIPRRLQYSLWLAIPAYLVLAPFLNIKIPVYNSNAINKIMETWNNCSLK